MSRDRVDEAPSLRTIARRAGTPLVLAVPAYLAGQALGTVIGLVWNASEASPNVIQGAARLVGQPVQQRRAEIVRFPADRVRPTDDPGPQAA